MRHFAYQSDNLYDRLEALLEWLKAHARQGLKVLVDNGHGEETPGKRSPDARRNLTSSPYYLREFAWTREEACMMCDVLMALGIDAELLVPETVDVPLKERARRVNEWCKKLGKDNVLLVSVHINAAGDGKNWMTARGWAIYTTRGETESDVVADYFCQRAKEVFLPTLRLRLYKDKYLERDREENFYILYHTACSAVLVENFFQDNKEDVLYLNSDRGKAECMEVMVDGVINYMVNDWANTLQ